MTKREFIERVERELARLGDKVVEVRYPIVLTTVTGPVRLEDCTDDDEAARQGEKE